jgi:hypothetical protein
MPPEGYLILLLNQPTYWLWHDRRIESCISLPTCPSQLSHLSLLPWSKAWYGISKKSRWSQRRPCQWAEEWGVRRKWKSNCTGSWWSRGSVVSTVRFPAWKRNKMENNSLPLWSSSSQVRSHRFGCVWKQGGANEETWEKWRRCLRRCTISLNPENQ